jgi:hypothetical protein
MEFDRCFANSAIPGIPSAAEYPLPKTIAGNEAKQPCTNLILLSNSFEMSISPQISNNLPLYKESIKYTSKI